MRISSIDISIHLDTHHKFEDIQQFILEEALKDVFKPIYEWKINQKLQSFDGEKLDKDFHINNISK